MGRMPDPVDDGIAHVDVRGGHVDLRPQDLGTVRELAGAHPGEKIKVLLDGAVAVGALFSGRRQRAAVFAHFTVGKLADIRLAEPDQLHRVFIKFFKIIRSEEQFVFPVRAEPADVLHDGLHVFGIFLCRIRVVETQMEGSSVFLRGAVVQADGLGMSDVQISVRFRRETGHDFPVGFSRPDFLVDDFMNKVRCGRRCFIFAHFKNTPVGYFAAALSILTLMVSG